jgi:hypothetical protein
MEWELPGVESESSPPQLVAELCGAQRGRLLGSRGLHATFLLRDGPRLVLIMVLDSAGMLDAYARWTRIRVLRRLGLRPSREETFELVGAVAGGAGLTRVLGARSAA